MSSTSWRRAVVGCAIAIALTAQEAIAQLAATDRAAVPLQDARRGNLTALRAAADYFLKPDGVPGESERTSGPRKDNIDIESWSWGQTTRRGASGNSGGGSVVIEVLARSATSPGPGIGSERRRRTAEPQTVGLRKGDALGTLMLEAVANGDGERGWVRYVLHGVRVSSVTTDTRNGRAIEKITMSYQHVTLQRSGRAPAGIAPASPSRASN